VREERIKVVSVLDPAVDTESMSVTEMADYLKTRDFKKLKFKQGVKPTVYHLKEAARPLWVSWVMAVDGDAERAARCFQACVERVENLYQRDGVCLPDWKPNGYPMPDESLERFSLNDILEIGQVAWDHSYLPARIEPSYRLPPTSHTCLIRRDFRLADASPSQPAASSSEASSVSDSIPQAQPETAHGNSESVDPSGSVTAATAEATA
jgi:hypothetical protein